jgi:hypothetical protein
MVDLTKLMLGHTSGDVLWKFVHDNAGGNSVEFLKRLGRLTGRRDTLTMAGEDALCEPGSWEKVKVRFDSHGPALIRCASHTDGGVWSLVVLQAAPVVL